MLGFCVLVQDLALVEQGQQLLQADAVAGGDAMGVAAS
jgi:hypothetical protein